MKLEQWVILINVLLSLLNPAMVAAQGPVRNCLRFREDYPVPATPDFGPVFTNRPPLMDHEILAVTGGTQAQCQAGLELVKSALSSHPLIEKMFITLSKLDPQYRVSFHAPHQHFRSQARMGLFNGLSHFINLNMNERMAKYALIHETFHAFVLLANHGDPLKVDPALIFSDFEKILSQGMSKLTAVKKLMMNTLAKHPVPLTAQEKKVLNKVKDLANNNKQSFPAQFYYAIPTGSMPFPYETGEFYSISNIINLRAKVLAVEDLSETQKIVYFECEDPLFATFVRFEYAEQKITSQYLDVKKDQEYLAYLFENMPVDLINYFFPDLITQINRMLDQLIEQETVQNLDLPRGDDLSYLFNFEIEFWVLMKDSLESENELNTVKGLCLHIIQNKGVEYYGHALNGIKAAFNSTLHLNNQARASLHVLEGELHTLAGNKRQALIAYKKADGLDKLALISSALGRSPLEHFNALSHQPLNNRLKRQLKN